MPRAFVLNLVRQIYKLPEYKMHLKEKRNETLRRDVEMILSSGVSRDGESISSTDSMRLFMSCVLKPLKAISNDAPIPGRGHVLLVDGLDEALRYQGSERGDSSSVVRMLQICNAKQLFPPWLKVLATSRDIRELNEMRAWRWIRLESPDQIAQSSEPIRMYIRSKLQAKDSALLAAIGARAVLVWRLPVVNTDKVEKLRTFLRSDKVCDRVWGGSRPQLIDMPLTEGNTMGYAQLAFDTPVRV